MKATNIDCLSLEVTNRCNLRCRYCYLKQSGNSECNPAQDHLMSEDIGCRSIDFLLEHSGQSSACYISFMGGEPLLNWPLITKIVKYGKKRFDGTEKKIKFGLTTNGLLLDSNKIKSLIKYRIPIMVSFDGSRVAQNSMRIFRTGKGSYDRVVKKIEMLRDSFGSLSSKYISIRATVTRFDLDLVKIVENIESLGIVRFHLTPVTYSDLSQDIAIRLEDLPILFSGYKILADRFFQSILDGHTDSFPFFRKILSRIVAAQSKTITCGAGNHYCGVSTDGRFYICHRFYGLDSGRIGSIDNGIDRTFKERIAKLPVDKKKECDSCWIRKYCGGPCYFDGLLIRNNFFLPNRINCKILKYLFSLTLNMYSRLLKEHPNSLLSFINNLKGKDNGDAMSIIKCIPIEEYEKPNELYEWLYSYHPLPRQIRGVEVHEFDGEMVLYDTNYQKVYSINQTAKAIWELCDGTRSISEISDKLASQFCQSSANILSDIQTTILHFGKCNLLEESQKIPAN